MNEISLSILEKYEKYVDYPNHVRADEKCRFLYLFRNPFSNLCKIGVTNNPKTRLRQLTNSSGMEIQALIVLQLQPDVDEHPIVIEKFLHEHFSSKRTNGEWFSLSVRDILAISRLIYEIDGDDIRDSIRFFLSTQPRKWDILMPI